MAFNISYIYKAVDRFTPVANRIKRSVDGISDKANKASLSLKTLGGNLLGLGTKMAAFATLPILYIGNSFVKAASDAEESASKFATVFSSIETNADSVARNLGKNYGLSRTASKQLLGDTGDLLTGFGFTQESALGLSKQVQELAVDLASFTNFSGGAEGASKALTKALLGERESVKSLGISILEEDVKARVKQLVQVEKMRFASMRQAKAFATLQLAQEQSKNAIGDFARTSSGYANQVRIMSNELQNLKETLGVILLPIALKIVQVVKELSNKFENLSPKVQKLILATAGLVAVVAPLLLIIGGMAIAMGFLLSPVGLLVVGIMAMAGAAAYLYNKFKVVRDIVTILYNGISIFFKILSDGFDRVTTKITKFASKFEFIKNVGEKISSFFPDGSFFQNISNAAKDMEMRNSDFGAKNRSKINSDAAAMNGRLDGRIVVEAEKGTSIKRSATTTSGIGANLGLSLAGAY